MIGFAMPIAHVKIILYFRMHLVHFILYVLLHLLLGFTYK